MPGTGLRTVAVIGHSFGSIMTGLPQHNMMFIYAKAYVMFTEIAVTGGRPGLHEWAAIPPQTRPKPAPAADSTSSGGL